MAVVSPPRENHGDDVAFRQAACGLHSVISLQGLLA